MQRQKLQHANVACPCTCLRVSKSRSPRCIWRSLRVHNACARRTMDFRLSLFHVPAVGESFNDWYAGHQKWNDFSWEIFHVSALWSGGWIVIHYGLGSIWLQWETVFKGLVIYVQLCTYFYFRDENKILMNIPMRILLKRFYTGFNFKSWKVKVH